MCKGKCGPDLGRNMCEQRLAQTKESDILGMSKFRMQKHYNCDDWLSLKFWRKSVYSCAGVGISYT